MYRTLLGEAGFRKGTDLYFERHDGSAATCDDFRPTLTRTRTRTRSLTVTLTLRLQAERHALGADLLRAAEEAGGG